MLPGEIAGGYSGRIARTHGFGSADLMLRHVRDVLRVNSSTRSLQMVELLAHASGTSLELFVRSHTLLPLQRIVRDSSSDHPFGDPRYPTLLSRSMQLLRGRVYYCPTCISEDLEIEGVSYWRREHQVGGAWRCERHPQELLSHAAQAAIAQAPSSLPFRCTNAQAREPERPCVANRLIRICHSLLNRGRPLRMETAIPAIRNRAKSLGVRTLNSETGTVLSDLVMDTFDVAWLLEVCPQLASKRAGKQIPGIDDWVTTRAPMTNRWSLPVIMATLWQSVDDAMASLAPAPAVSALDIWRTVGSTEAVHQ